MSREATFRVAAVLLEYPDESIFDATAKLREMAVEAGGPGAPGLVSFLDRRAGMDVWAAREEYVATFAEDPARASRHFAESVVSSGKWADAQARGEGKARWVDTTPANARAADRVLALFPDGVVVHMMRDGRDVAASFVSKPFGPTDVFAALEEWRERMIDAYRAEKACPPGRFLRVDLHELTVTDREATLAGLLEGIGVGPDRRLTQWFDANVLPQQAHIGRWRRDYDDATAARIDARYDEILAEFDAAGVPYPKS